MKGLQVYVQYPWRFPDSPYYKNLIENPPKGVQYINCSRQKGVIINKRKFFFANKIKEIIRKIVEIFHLPIPNAHKTRSKIPFDLIHCAHCLSLNKSPWVADFEGDWQMFVSGEATKMGKKIVKKILLDKNCKKIMPWTKNTANKILELFPEVKDKVEVVYPAVPSQNLNKNNHDKITIIYVSRYFWIKGGLLALDVLSRIKENYDVKIIFVADVPEEIKSKYPKIEIKNLMPYEDLKKLYSESDIFFYPSFVDTFGFALLEAMSFGLPIISVNTKSTLTRKEVLENNKHGFLVEAKEKINYYQLGEYEKKLAEELFKKTCYLIENNSMRKKMSQNCIKEIENGRFSLKKRDAKLKKIYLDCVKEE